MDKKNTMLLTVIAVATLLVAVVGATFAYFSVTNSSSESAATNATVRVEDVGTVALGGGGKNLYVNVSAAQMAIGNAGTPYYSTETDIPASTSITKSTIAEVELTGGKENVKYECTWKITPTVKVADPDYGTEGHDDEFITGTLGDMILEGDAELVLEGATFAADTKYDVKTGLSSYINAKSQLTAALDGTDVKASDEVKAYLIFHNRTESIKVAGTGYAVGDIIETTTTGRFVKVTAVDDTDNNKITAVEPVNATTASTSGTGAEIISGNQNYASGAKFRVELTHSDFSCDVVEDFS